EGEEEVAAGDQASTFKLGAEDVAGRARVSRALEDDELPGLQIAADRLAGGRDGKEVGLAGLAQRSRHADQDRVELGEPREVVGRLEAAAVAQGRDPLARDVSDVALAGLEPLDLG